MMSLKGLIQNWCHLQSQRIIKIGGNNHELGFRHVEFEVSLRHLSCYLESVVV